MSIGLPVLGVDWSKNGGGGQDFCATLFIIHASHRLRRALILHFL